MAYRTQASVPSQMHLQQVEEIKTKTQKSALLEKHQWALEMVQTKKGPLKRKNLPLSNKNQGMRKCNKRCSMWCQEQSMQGGLMPIRPHRCQRSLKGSLPLDEDNMGFSLLALSIGIDIHPCKLPQAKGKSTFAHYQAKAAPTTLPAKVRHLATQATMQEFQKLWNKRWLLLTQTWSSIMAQTSPYHVEDMAANLAKSHSIGQKPCSKSCLQWSQILHGHGHRKWPNIWRPH